MRIGCCVNMLPRERGDVGASYAELLRRVGYDYVELPLGELIQLGEEDFAALCRRLTAAGIPVYACNSLFPPALRLVGETVDESAVRAFYRRALARAAQLGAQRVVFGSPWAKSCPEGFPRETAFAQLVQWCGELGDEAARYGITIALEPNNHTEGNMITTYAEALALARATAHPAVRCLQDYYHLCMENDTTESMLRGGAEYLAHVHFARFDGRGFPASMDEDPGYRPFFDTLRTLHYHGGISMEGFPASRESLTREAAATCRFLRAAVQEAD